MKDKIISLRRFFDGKFYPLFIFLAVIISYMFSLEWLGIIFILGSVYIAFIICDQMKFLISPLFMLIFMFSQKTVSSEGFYSVRNKILIIIAFALLALSIIAHFIIYRQEADYSSLFKSKLFYGFISLFIAFLLNGMFDFKEYVSGNIIYAVFLVLSFAIPLFLFSVNLKFDEDLKKYFVYVLYLVSVLLAIETLFVLFTQARFDNGSIVKESMVFGWGIWNNAGGMMALCLPVHFYLAYSHKKGFIFFITAAISYICVALTLSRSSLLVSTLIFIICTVIICIKGKNAKINRILTASFLFIGIIIALFLKDKIFSLISDYLQRGIDDNGRFDIYLHGLNNFSNHPVFGAGFYNSYKLEYKFISFLPDRYHNTIIQILATCGLIGIASYIFHRYQTVKIMLKNKSVYNFFIILCIVSLLLTSLLDNHMFNIYPAFYYVIMLLIIEKSPVDS